MSENQNLSINGSGSYGGGIYNKINIRGEGTITTDFECHSFKTFGTSDLLKNGKAEQFDIFGETEIRGDLDVNKMKIFGTAEVGGTAKVKIAKIFGTLEVGNRFTGEEANIKGSLSVNGDTEFENFRSTGAFEVKGLLNAGTIEISLRFGKSTANEIGGEKIVVKKKSGLFPFMKGEGTLEARVIEGDEIYLENTKAEVVRGKKVHIGTGCNIALVEYQERLTTDSNTIIKENHKIN
ncbi:cytoplasmic protein [Bacillus sp. CGMCC 1.16607]|uniref:cytoplasmic protein n=1 Tax=Bacillus sp. CGMCC 1.16607 TaxID=3351842 RepID=UPI003640E8D0